MFIERGCDLHGVDGGCEDIKHSSQFKTEISSHIPVVFMEGGSSGNSSEGIGLLR